MAITEEQKAESLDLIDKSVKLFCNVYVGTVTNQQGEEAGYIMLDHLGLIVPLAALLTREAAETIIQGLTEIMPHITIKESGESAVIEEGQLHGKPN